jgi:hypothetical protein
VAIKYIERSDLIVDTERFMAKHGTNDPDRITLGELRVLEAIDMVGHDNTTLLNYISRHGTAISRNNLKVVKSGLKQKFGLEQI